MAKVTIRGIRALDKQLGRQAGVYNKAASRALNRTAQRTRTRARRRLADALGLPQREVGGRIRSFNSTPGKLVARVWIGLARAFKLADIGGAFFNLRKGTLKAGRHIVRPFRATMPNGRTGLFVRKLNSDHSRGGELIRRDDGQRTELPIEEPQVRIDPVLGQQIIEEEADEQMRTFFPDEIQRLLRRSKKR